MSESDTDSNISEYSDNVSTVEELEDNESENIDENIVEEIKTENLNTILITGDKRKTRPVMTRFEYALLIGKRAKQIEKNSPGPHNITLTHPDSKNLTYSLDIAEFELNNIEIPISMIIKRNINDKYSEIWEVRELELPFFVKEKERNDIPKTVFVIK